MDVIQSGSVGAKFVTFNTDQVILELDIKKFFSLPSAHFENTKQPNKTQTSYKNLSEWCKYVCKKEFELILIDFIQYGGIIMVVIWLLDILSSSVRECLKVLVNRPKKRTVEHTRTQELLNPLLVCSYTTNILIHQWLQS